MEQGGQTPAGARKWHVLGFVLLAAAGVYAVAVSLALGLWRQNSPGEHGLRTTLVRLCAYLAALIFYAAALDALGFIVSTVLVVVFILRIAEGYGWHMTLGIAVGTAVGCQLLFVYWLGAILPTGFLWDKMFY